MKKRTVFLIVVVVALVHVGAFYFLKDAKPLPKRKHVAPPTFTMRHAETTLPETGEKLTYREFTVSTRLEERPFYE